MQIYLNVLALSVTACVCVGGLLLLRKWKRKNASVLWINLAWLVLCVRLLIPVPILSQHIIRDISGLFITTSAEAIYEDNRIPPDQQQTGLTNIHSSEESYQTMKDSSDLSEDSKVMNQNSTETATVRKFNLKSIKDHFKGYLTEKMLKITFTLWVSGILIFTSWHLLAYLSFLRRVKRGKTLRGVKEQQQILDQLRMRLGIQKEIKCYHFDEINSPMLAGILQPQVLLPDMIYSVEEMEAILKHELTHYSNHDMMKKLLLLIIRIVYWFCPAVYVMGRYACQDFELFCDEAVVKGQDTEYRKCYSMAILRTAANVQKIKTDPFSACLSKGKVEMKDRIQHILNGTKKKRGAGAAAFSLLMILLISNQCMNSMLLNNLKDAAVVKAARGPIYPAQRNTDVNTFDMAPVKKIEASKEQQQQKSVSRIVLIGLETICNAKNPDCIMLLTIDHDNQQVVLTSVSRQLCVKDEKGTAKKIMSLYSKDTDGFYQCISDQLNVPVDGVVTIDMESFETTMDTLGGADITLTKEEAEYLNRTNFISKAENRCMKTGTQHMNGNQLLGYARVRYVAASDGEQGEWGRSYRHQQIIRSLFATLAETDASHLIETVDQLAQEVKMSFSIDELNDFVLCMTQGEWKLVTESYPGTEDSETIKEGNQYMLDCKDSLQYHFQDVKD